MSIHGILINQRGKKRDHLAECKVTAMVAGYNVLPDVRMPRKPRKDRGVVRGPSQHPERLLRIDVLKHLKKMISRILFLGF